tara:strand:- start:305 stop:913 length:609 start_codon:yes stop_codon:yes gene_type:complete
MNFKIHETFQKVVQGEGFHSGRPCDFIRLYGCGVGCHYCDTGYSRYNKKKISFTIKNEKELLKELKSKFVVISGGEPFINKNLPDLCNYLLDNDIEVSIETSGAFYLDIDKRVWITLSPKHHISKYPVKKEFYDRANELKIVIENGREVDFYKDLIKKFNGLKYLQPENDCYDRSLEITLQLLQKMQDFKLSLQLHKFIGVQ